MAMDEIKVVVREPGKKAEVRTVANTLEAFQQIVGGHIEMVTAEELFFSERVFAYVNEDGKQLGLPPNVSIHRGADVVRGTLVLSRVDRSGYDTGFTEVEAESLRARLDGVPHAGT